MLILIINIAYESPEMTQRYKSRHDVVSPISRVVARDNEETNERTVFCSSVDLYRFCERW